jgi:hypothetical protein
MRLKESHENGAIDNINKAFKTSEEAAYLLNSVDGRFASELKPAVTALQSHIDSSREVFERSDQILREYLSGVMSNLSKSMDGVFDLNQAVTLR